jgi:RNA ligase
MIQTLKDIQDLIRAGETNWQQYGEVNAIYHNDLVLFNYTQSAQFMRRWNWFELNSRGLIFNAKTGEIVARPFRKFFNYGEKMPMPSAALIEVTEKLDGSLGILYREDGTYRIATRGAFVSEQAQWATHYLHAHHDLTGLADELTLLFEIIYPDNRVVVNYGDFEGLILIGARNRFYGQELYAAELDLIAQQYDFLRPKTYDFTDPHDILDAAEQITASEEGWVLRYSDNERYKIKGTAYKLAHRILTGCSFRRVLEAVAQDKFDEMIAGVPDEFLGQVKLWQQEIETVVVQISTQVSEALSAAPPGEQKDFALWVQANYPRTFQAYLYAAKADKPLEPLIYKHAFENRHDADQALVADEG